VIEHVWHATPKAIAARAERIARIAVALRR